MRLRHIKGAEEEIAESPYVVQDPQSLKGKWHEFFGNDNPIRIEVGMGKGKFIMELAQMNPDINYGESSAIPAFCFADFRNARNWNFLISIL